MKYLLLLSLVSLVACSTQSKKLIEDKKNDVDMELVDRSYFELTHDKIVVAKGIDEGQRTQLSDLHNKSWEEYQKLNKEVKRYKVVLFDLLLDEKKDNAIAIKETTKKIKNLYNSKIDLVKRSVKEAKKILGKNKLTSEQANWFYIRF